MKKSILFVFVSILVLIFLTACGTLISNPLFGAEDNAYKKISSQEVKQMLDFGESIKLIDMRKAEEYEEGHIPGAFFVAPNATRKDIYDKLPDSDATVIIYSSSDSNSKKAARKLIMLGYTDVFDMGSFNNWEYETISGSELGEWVPKPQGILSSFFATEIFGETVDETVLENCRLTMVNIWGTFCEPCIDEMPDLGKLSMEYQDQDFQIIGLVIDVLDYDGSINQSQLEAAKEIVLRTEADYLHILPSGDLYALLGEVTAVPTTFFVDSAGNQVGEVYVGSRTKEEWKEIVDFMLAEVYE